MFVFIILIYTALFYVFADFSFSIHPAYNIKSQIVNINGLFATFIKHNHDDVISRYIYYQSLKTVSEGH